MVAHTHNHLVFFTDRPRLFNTPATPGTPEENDFGTPKKYAAFPRVRSVMRR